MKLTMTSNCRKGFTLIELMVVIAIIGILFTLVSPQISKARLRGKLTQQAHHAKSIVEAILAVEAGSTFSTGWPSRSDTNTTSSTDYFVSLVEGGYLDVDYAFFAGPNMRPAMDRTDFETNPDECNAWSVLLDLNDATPGNLPAVFMRSYNFSGGGFSDEHLPVGLHGFAFATKNGAGIIVQQGDMNDSAAFDAIFNRKKLDAIEGLSIMEP
ncbi:MAG: type II secretion system protein [Pontiella sp.]